MATRRGIASSAILIFGFPFTGLLGVLGLSPLALGAPTDGNKSASIIVGGISRTYFDHLPPHYDHRTPMPVIPATARL